MHLVDWIVVAAYFAWILTDGIRRSHRTNEVEGYFLANRSLPWWAVGLSVMATQLSAITLVGTTGRGFGEGMSVLQLYFGLPLAMIILSVTVVPFFYRARVYTAYEYLERRFDVKTRTLTSLLFLLSRGLSCGAVLSAPSVILSVIFDWNLPLTVLAMGVPAVGYTLIGGVQAVTWADVKQMFVIVAGVGGRDRRPRRRPAVGDVARQRAASGRRHRPPRTPSTSASRSRRPTRSGRASSAACS